MLRFVVTIVVAFLGFLKGNILVARFVVTIVVADLDIKESWSFKCQWMSNGSISNQDTLRDALQITPVDNNLPSYLLQLLLPMWNFVNELGIQREVCPMLLQILWGIANRAHIDYAERMWEEFTQSIHTFTEDKRKLAQHTLGKKKATLILIQASGHLKFSAKGSKREVFGMTIPNELINDVIRGADYYDAYLEKIGDEFVDEGVPAAKPSLEDSEEAILQKVLQESLTDAYPIQRGPLPPVVFREPNTEKLQPLLPEVAKEGEGECSDTESDEEMPSVGRSGNQDGGQAGLDHGTLDEGQGVGSGPGTRDEGQAGPNPDDTNIAESLPLPTPSVLAGPNLELSDVEITVKTTAETEAEARHQSLFSNDTSIHPSDDISGDRSVY
ncbi:hypothetical protein Tco_1234691 [Tanacetum coccineum]